MKFKEKINNKKLVLKGYVHKQNTQMNIFWS